MTAASFHSVRQRRAVAAVEEWVSDDPATPVRIVMTLRSALVL